MEAPATRSAAALWVTAALGTVALCAAALWIFADRGPSAGASGVPRPSTAGEAVDPTAPRLGTVSSRASPPAVDAPARAVVLAPASSSHTHPLTIRVLGLGPGESADARLAPTSAALATGGATSQEHDRSAGRRYTLAGPEAAVTVDRRDFASTAWLEVLADGYALVVLALPKDGGELTVTLEPVDPLVLEFPGLAGRRGRFELATTGPRPLQVVEIDAAGRATLRAVPEEGQLGFQLQTRPERSGEPRVVPVLGGSQAFDRLERRFRYEDVRAHRVELLPPVAGERFELSFRLIPPEFARLPTSPGWSGAYGLYWPLRFSSDQAGVLVVDLLEGTTSDVLFEGAVSGSFEFPPLAVAAPGPIALDP